MKDIICTKEKNKSGVWGMEHLEENCQIKNVNVLNICNISKGFMIRIFALLYHNYNGNKYVLFISGELIILTIVK